MKHYRSLLPLIAALAFFQSAARAHDPFLAEIAAAPGSDALVLRVVLVRSVAAHLAGLTPGPRNHFPVADFAAHQTDFARLASGLCIVHADNNNAPIELLHAEAALSADEEAVFTLTYPRPTTKSIRVECPWLLRLPEGYAALLHRNAVANRSSAGAKLLSAETPAADLDLTPAPAPAPSPVP